MADARFITLEDGSQIVEILLNRGNVAVIDAEDLSRVSQYHCFSVKSPASRTFYAGASVRVLEKDKRGRRIVRRLLMHRIISGCVGQVDHKDLNGLNNRRNNLRPATAAQQHGNVHKTRSKTSSQFKGVRYRTKNNRWEAYIRMNYKQVHLGTFIQESDAAAAYDVAALEYFGEFARLNLPDKDLIQ